MIDVSVVIITYNRKEKVERLIQSVLNANWEGLTREVIVVDDCSPDGTFEFLKNKYTDHPEITLLQNEVNSKASHSRNRGIGASCGRYIFCIDDDVVVHREAFQELYKTRQSLVGQKVILAPLMFEYEKPDVLWYAGVRLNMWTTFGTFQGQGRTLDEYGPLPDTLETDTIVTAFFMDRSCLEEVGVFDEKRFPFQFEEMDFFNRSGFFGYRLLVVSPAHIYHDHEQGAFLNHPWRLELTAKNKLLTCKLWSSSLLQEYVSLAFSTATLLAYFGLKLLVYRKEQMACMKALVRGMRDGFKGLKSITPYRQVYREHLISAEQS